jgi:PIN domain nuclease of toxin-antitoxin system
VRLLLDTVTFLWLNLDSPRLSAIAKEACASLENELHLSCVSCWEIAVKYTAEKLRLPQPPAAYIPARRKTNGIRSLALDEEAVLQLPKLPPLHADPFDRMLICQAITHGLGIVTPDEQIARYPVRVLW